MMMVATPTADSLVAWMGWCRGERRKGMEHMRKMQKVRSVFVFNATDQ